MTKNRKNLAVVFLAVVAALLTASSSQATQLLTATINVPTAAFLVSNQGTVTMVTNDGVPLSIVVTGRELIAQGAGVDINGAAGPGSVLLTFNLSLLPGTMPLTFNQSGAIHFTAGGGVVSLALTGKATEVNDPIMQTRTLRSSGNFVITNAVGDFANRVGVTGTFTLAIASRLVPGELFPATGTPVDVTFSAIHIVF